MAGFHPDRRATAGELWGTQQLMMAVVSANGDRIDLLDT
jgi:hypothetical protein